MSNDRISIGYPTLQLHQSLLAARDHKDSAVRERARKKCKRWERVLAGMTNGSISVGSRAPVKNAPVWLTLEVVTGGFATGHLLAGGDLLPFELDLLSRLRPDETSSEKSARTLLNHYFISDQGFGDLLARLEACDYEITVPEEGALLVAAWLANNGFPQDAVSLIETLTPYFSEVRFYPQPAEAPQKSTGKVFLRDVRTVRRDLQQIKTPRGLLSQREAITVWQSFRQELVTFLSSTGEPGQPYPDQSHHSTIQTFLDQYRTLRSQHKLCRKPLRKDSLGQTIAILQDFVKTGALTDSQRSRLGVLCARFEKKFGAVGTPLNAARHAAQQQQIDIPVYADIAKVVNRRLAELPQSTGVENFQDVIGNVQADESMETVAPGTPLPDSIVNKLERCMMEPVEILVERQVIKSPDTLAVVLPQVTGNLKANDIESGSLRMLYAAIYRAFRQRRSLLLLDYNSQVQLEELPWIELINQVQPKQTSKSSAALAAMQEVAKLAIVHFPFAIVPNKLLQEFRAISKSANVELPLVDELAADIFMGGFSNKFARSAQLAGELLRGTLYETYYQIDYQEIAKISLTTKKTRSWTPPVCKAFGRLCQRRAQVSRSASYVAGNGTVIEQQQILTSQNLAVLLSRLDLVDKLKPDYINLAQSCFRWICQQLQIKDPYWHGRLIKVKNSAYAWRQMLVFLSLTTQKEQSEFVTWAEEHLNGTSANFASRFDGAVQNLKTAVSTHDRGGSLPRDFQPFLGWTTGTHWLLKGDES